MLVFVLLAVVIVCVAAATVAGNPARTKASHGLAVAALLAAALAAKPMLALVWDDSGLGFALAITAVPLALVTGRRVR